MNIKDIEEMMKIVHFKELNGVVLFLQDPPNKEAEKWLEKQNCILLACGKNLWAITKDAKELETKRAKKTIEMMLKSM